MSVAGCLRRFCVSGVEEVAPSMRIGTGANCVGPSFYELAPRLGSWPLHQLQSIHRIFKFLIKRVVSQKHKQAPRATKREQRHNVGKLAGTLAFWWAAAFVTHFDLVAARKTKTCEA